MSTLFQKLLSLCTTLQPLAVVVIAVSLAVTTAMSVLHPGGIPSPAPTPVPGPTPVPVTSTLVAPVKTYHDNMPLSFAKYRDGVTSGTLKTAKDIQAQNAANGGAVAQEMANTILRHADSKTGAITDPSGLALEFDQVAKALGSKQ